MRASIHCLLFAVAGISISPIACATLADGGGGDDALPNAAAGPFRELENGEIGNLRSAPNALDDEASFPRDITVIDIDDDPNTQEIYGYVARNVVASDDEEPDFTTASNQIVRLTALDGRTFDRQATPIIDPEMPWEGSFVGAPAIVRLGGEFWLYYATAQGIGLATSADGANFVKRDAPVLSAPDSGWDLGTVPRSPGVVVVPDGLRMFYEINYNGEPTIGEATSTDGISWQRVGNGPVLRGAAPVDATDESGGVGGPCPILITPPNGTPVLRLYYAAYATGGASLQGNGTSVIALAARDGVDGVFFRAVGPVFGLGTTFRPREPAVASFADATFLFATQKAGRLESLTYPAVAVGLAPADAPLAPPNPL